LLRCQYIGHLDHILKTDYRGDGRGLDPHQEHSTPNAYDCRWCSYLKALFPESNQFLGEDLKFAHCDPEEGAPLFLIGEKREVIQVNVCTLSHAQDAAVQEIYSQG